jgi:2'-5' RNA ligase
VEVLPSIVAGLRDIAHRRGALEVELLRAIALPGRTHTNAWYEARRTRALMGLHRDCRTLLSPHRRPVDAGAFARRPRERVSPSSLRWVARFEEDASGARYRPHVTLGYGTPAPDPALPLRFRAHRLALCRLGNHCTCARVIARVRLT